MKRFNFPGSRVSSLTLALMLLPLAVPALVNADEAAPSYTVQCEEGSAAATACKVDKKTYIGWRTYHANCHVCHAQDAVGSTFAPSLLDRMKEISKERYMESMAHGYTGQIGVMPAWKDNPNVNKRYEELYLYLSARADGVLPPGRPKRLK